MSEGDSLAYGIGSFMWNEGWTRDLKASQSFYSKVLDWDYDAMDMGEHGTYYIIKCGERMVGGMGEIKGEHWGDAPSHWAFYIDVESVDDARKRVNELGGKVESETFEIPDVGRFCQISAPDGSRVFLMTPAHRATETPRPEPGEFIWIELMSRDFDRARDFYTKLLGWKTEAMPAPSGGEYTIFNTGNGSAGGGMQLREGTPDDVPSIWVGYIHVADIDKTIQTAEKEGAMVVMPPMEVPDVGRIAHVADPAGALIAFIQPAPMGE